MTSLHIGPASVAEGDGLFGAPGAVHLRPFGKRALLIAEWFILERFRPEWRALLRGHEVVEGMTSGPCTPAEADRLAALLPLPSGERVGVRGASPRVDFVLGLGGGRSLDLAKAVGRRLSIPVVTVPTSAATCAAWSALSAMYTRRGETLGYELLDRAPDLLLLDTRLVSKAPARLLASGMADGLAKYYEGMAFTRDGRAPGLPACVTVALSAARELYDTVWSLGPAAYADARGGRVTEPVRSIVRANIVLAGLVGGLGGEGCRAAAAHAINNGLTRVDSARRWLHGETVGLGILAQLHLEGKRGEADRLKRLFLRLGLPTRLRDVGVVPGSPAAHRVAAWACSPRETMRNMPRRITRPALLRSLSAL